MKNIPLIYTPLHNDKVQHIYLQIQIAISMIITFFYFKFNVTLVDKAIDCTQ